MNLKNFIRKIDTDISDSNLSKGAAVLYLSPFIALFISMAIDKIVNVTQDAIQHGYDIKVKAGQVDIALTKNN